MRPDLEKQFRRCRGLGLPSCNNLRYNEDRKGVLDWHRLLGDPGPHVISRQWCGRWDDVASPAVRDSRAALL